MSADAERAILSRAEGLTEATTDIADQITTLIARARRARVDQSALRGPVLAVRALDGDAFRLMAACRGRAAARPYSHDADLLADSEDIEAELGGLHRAALALAGDAAEALDRARADAASAADDLAAAQALTVHEQCDGCHAARAAAIDAAREGLRDCATRARHCADALTTLRGLRFGAALTAMRLVPGDLQSTYEAAYDLVAADPRAMPGDGDFITGERPAT